MVVVVVVVVVVIVVVLICCTLQCRDCVVSAAIDEAVALFKKRKPSDRDTTQCKGPSSYAAGALSVPSEETLSAFEFKVVYVVCI